MFQKLKLLSLPAAYRKFFLFAFFTGAFICMDYAIVRPICTSVFLKAFGSSWYPYVWLTTIPLNVLCVGLYNSMIVRLGCLRTFLCFTSVVVSTHTIASMYLQMYPWLSFFYYAWKEVYVMLMLHQLWSVVQATFSMREAKFFYGILFAGGGLGGIVGSVIPGIFAVQIGSEQLLLLAIPILPVAFFLYAQMLKCTDQGLDYKLEVQERMHIGKAFMHGISLIRSSRVLPLILFVCVFMHLSMSFVEFQFGAALETTLQDQDVRTQMLGRIFGLVQMVSLSLQLIGSFLLLQFLGLKRSFMLIPFLMGLHQLAYVIFPTFGIAALLYGTQKVMHYSTFSVLKEMMYTPLQQDEKFRAKAFIDVFVDRSAKAMGSLLILGCQTLLMAHVHLWISLFALFLFIAWYLVVKMRFNVLESNRPLV